MSTIRLVLRHSTASNQLGDMRTDITKAFERYHLFGFTGTPIFADNADNNVLPFRIDYVLDHYDTKTKRAQHYRHGDQRLFGFNSLFAAASIDAAKRYDSVYAAEQRKREDADPAYRRLKIGVIYSYAPNEDPDQGAAGGLLAEEEFETGDLDASSGDFLDDAIADYNDLFDTSADQFQNYYTNLSQRLRNRDLDLVIVVNMFLTGFDATILNTLWVDKFSAPARADPGVLAHQPHPQLGQDLWQHRVFP